MDLSKLSSEDKDKLLGTFLSKLVWDHHSCWDRHRDARILDLMERLDRLDDVLDAAKYLVDIY